MGGWMETARANARAMDQAMKQNPYKERLHLAGESARKNGLAPQSVQTASSAIKPTEIKIADPMAGLRSRESGQYLLSDDLKSAGEQMKSGLNAKLVTDGEFANTAVKNLRANGQTEVADNLKSQLDALERERYIAELEANRSSQKKEQLGKQQKPIQTFMHTLNEGAGLFNQAVFSTADFVANAIPRIEGIVLNEDPEATFTGQVLKPLTYVTGQLVDWAKRDTAASHEIVQANTANNKVANAVVSFAPSVIAALPNAVLAFLSGGASVGGQLAAQSTGLSGTITAAASKMLHNPMTAVSFAQMLGPSYDQAKDRGANDVEAMTSATISALFNTIVEVSGGIEALPMEIRNVDLSNAQKAWRWVTSALGEGNEEVVQGVVSEMTNKAVFEGNKPVFSPKDETAVINPERMAKEFGGGAAIGGLLGGGQVLSDIAIKKLNEIDLSNVTTNDARKVRNLENASKKQVEAFVQKAYLNQNECKYMKISEVTPNLAEELKTVGLYVENGNHVLRDNDLRHIVYRHGKYSSDKYKVQDEDYQHLRNIIENYDELYLGYPTNDGSSTIVYEKTIDQKIFYVEEVLEDGVLATKQMIKVGKKRKPSFLKKFTKITDATPDTDVPPEAEPTGLH